MARLEVIDHRTIYRNPSPSHSSEYVSFPAIHALPDNTLLCLCRHGSARESGDGIATVHRSTDGGLSWSRGGSRPELGGVPRFAGGFGVTSDGEALAWAGSPSGENGRRTYFTRSRDGVEWSAPTEIDTSPYPRFLLCGNLATLPDGTLVLAGEAGDGEQFGVPQDHWAGLSTRSTDGGRSWDAVKAAHVSKDPFYMDLRITGLADGRVLGVYWTHDMTNDRGMNVHSTFSADAGRTWTEPRDAGFWGQVTDACALKSGRVIAVTNHRREPLGIRAVLSDNDGATFDEANHLEVWGVEPARTRSAPVLAPKRDVVEHVMESYHFFTFGTPSVTQLSDGTIVVAFYVTEESVTYVRCCRMVERD